MQISDNSKITTCFSLFIYYIHTGIFQLPRGIPKYLTDDVMFSWILPTKWFVLAIVQQTAFYIATDSILYWQRTFYSSQTLAIKHHHSRCWPQWLVRIIFLNDYESNIWWCKFWWTLNWRTAVRLWLINVHRAQHAEWTRLSTNTFNKYTLVQSVSSTNTAVRIMTKRPVHLKGNK